MAVTLTDARRAQLVRRVRFLVISTITYNVIEAVVALAAGLPGFTQVPACISTWRPESQTFASLRALKVPGPKYLHPSGPT